MKIRARACEKASVKIGKGIWLRGSLLSAKKLVEKLWTTFDRNTGDVVVRIFIFLFSLLVFFRYLFNYNEIILFLVYLCNVLTLSIRYQLFIFRSKLV